MSTTESIASVSSKIDRQEIRIYQHDVQELRCAYDAARKRELEASKMLNMEKLRCQNQEMEIQRRREQIKESNEFIRKLQSELEDAKRTASGVKRELRENEIRSLLDSEIIQYKAQIAGLEDKLKSKQRNLEKISEVLRDRNALMERELTLLNGELAKKEQLYGEAIAHLHECGGSSEIGEFREKLDRLNQQIGSLKAINDSLQDKINGMQAERFELENKLRYAAEDKTTLQSQIDSLKEQMSNTEGSNQQLLRTLNDEIDKIKQQKAQLRCEYLQLKRNYTALDLEKKALGDQIESAKQIDVEQQKRQDEMRHEYEEILSKNIDLQKQIDKLKKELKDQRKQTEDLEQLVEENEACAQATIRQLKLSLEKEQAAKKEITDVVLALDSESERMLSKLRDVNQEKKAAVLENQSLKRELDELRSSMASQYRMRNELETMREENARLTLRIKYLENELTESRTEHRNELDRLAERMSAAAPTAAMAVLKSNAGEPMLCRSVEELQRALKQQESQCSYMERSMEQNKKELESVNKQMADMHKRQCELVNDNTLLRQALAEALKKAEKYRDENSDFRSSKDSWTSEVDRYQQKLQQMEDELYELRAELGQKEKLVAYLQSNQHPKQMQKLKRNRSSFSTLISVSNDSTSELELESQECKELERKRDWLRASLEQQRRVLSEKQLQLERDRNEIVPLLKTTTAAPLFAADHRKNGGGVGERAVHSPASKWVKLKRQLAKYF